MHGRCRRQLWTLTHRVGPRGLPRTGPGSPGMTARVWTAYHPPPPPPPPPPPEKPPPPPPPEKPEEEEETGWAAIMAALMPLATLATVLEKPPRALDQLRPRYQEGW